MKAPIFPCYLLSFPPTSQPTCTCLCLELPLLLAASTQKKYGPTMWWGARNNNYVVGNSKGLVGGSPISSRSSSPYISSSPPPANSHTLTFPIPSPSTQLTAYLLSIPPTSVMLITLLLHLYPAFFCNRDPKQLTSFLIPFFIHTRTSEIDQDENV